MGEETSLKVHASDEIPKTSIGMNWLMQNNLDVQVGDSVSVTTRGNMYWWQIRKEPNKYIVPTAGKCSWRKIWFFDRGYYIWFGKDFEDPTNYNTYITQSR